MEPLRFDALSRGLAHSTSRRRAGRTTFGATIAVILSRVSTRRSSQTARAADDFCETNPLMCDVDYYRSVNGCCSVPPDTCDREPLMCGEKQDCCLACIESKCVCAAMPPECEEGQNACGIQCFDLQSDVNHWDAASILAPMRRPVVMASASI